MSVHGISQSAYGPGIVPQERMINRAIEMHTISRTAENSQPNRPSTRMLFLNPHTMPPKIAQMSRPRKTKDVIAMTGQP